jgi:hypothetical protein
MAHTLMNPTNNTSSLRETFDAEFGLDPTEETKIADWVSEPVGAQKMGSNLYLRKLSAVAAQTLTPSTTAALRANLTITNPTDTRVTLAAVSKYGFVGFDRPQLNRVVDDGNFRKGIRKQMMAAIREGVDVSLFALGDDLSATESGAAIDDAMIRSALGQLATNAKGKFSADVPKLLVVHPTQLKNVWNVPAIKEYQIRGSAGSAVNLQMNAYGLVWRESGNVLNSGGSYYNPLLLKDAWALAWNEKPHILDEQIDGLGVALVSYAEFGVAEWFDSSGVALVIT